MTLNEFIVSFCDCASNDRVRKALGHEIHTSRIVVVDLLCKGLIDRNATIYTRPGREFLYSKIFNTVKTCCCSRVGVDGVIDLTLYGIDTTMCARDNPSLVALGSIGYHVNETQYRTSSFLHTINQFGIDPLCHELPESFIVVHFRTVAGYDNDVSILQLILSSCQSSFPEMGIILFWNTEDQERVDAYKRQYPSLFCVTNRLDVYAQYLAHPRCKFFLSEWSGGGQLAQYLTTAIIYFFFQYYPSCDYEKQYEQVLQTTNRLEGTIFGRGWDLKVTTSATIKLFLTVQECLEDMFLRRDDDVTTT